MKRIVTTFVATVAGLVALLGYKTHPATVQSIHAAIALSTTTTSTTENTTTSGRVTRTTQSPTTGGTNKSIATTTTTRPTTTTAQKSQKRTIDGIAENTRYGPVQVEIVVSGSQITSVAAIEYPSNSSRDRSINSYAVPQLSQEALSAQSANIDSVSGATYTSDGFATSLQSALGQI